MTGNDKLDWPKVQNSWLKILLTKISGLTKFLDLSGKGRSIIGRYLELFDKDGAWPANLAFEAVSSCICSRKSKCPEWEKGHSDYYAALESLSSFMDLVRTSLDSMSNHLTSTRFFLKYLSTSMTFPSILLLTRSPFLNNLLMGLIFKYGLHRYILWGNLHIPLRR